VNGWWGGHTDGWGGMGVGSTVLAGLLLGGLLLATAWLLLRRPTTPPPLPAHGARPTAQEVLAERFAQGDIDEEEYRWRLVVLGDRP